MPKLPRISGVDAIRALTKLGFAQIRQRGSHVVLKRMNASGARGCVVPLHSELATGTLRGVLKQAGVSVEEFMNQL